MELKGELNITHMENDDVISVKHESRLTVNTKTNLLISLDGDGSVYIRTDGDVVSIIQNNGQCYVEGKVKVIDLFQGILHIYPDSEICRINKHINQKQKQIIFEGDVDIEKYTIVQIDHEHPETIYTEAKETIHG